MRFHRRRASDISGIRLGRGRRRMGVGVRMRKKLRGGGGAMEYISFLQYVDLMMCCCFMVCVRAYVIYVHM